MNKWHQSGGLQALADTPRQLRLAGLLRLQAQRAGWLQVADGAAWLTRSGDSADHVLGAGDGLWLGAGEQVLAEPWRAGEAVDLRWAQSVTIPAQGLVRGLGDVLGSLASDPVAAALAGDRPAPRRAAVLGSVAGAVWWAAARGLRAAAGRLAAAARSAEAMANRAQGNIRTGDSIASSGALQQAMTARWPVRVPEAKGWQPAASKARRASASALR